MKTQKMSTERQNLLKLLFPHDDKFVESNENSELVDEYLTEIADYTVESLTKQPNHIRNERDIAEKRTQQLVIGNYSAFIEIAKCSKQLVCHFNAIECQLNGILEATPQFQATCQRFTQAAHAIKRSRDLNTLTLKYSSQLSAFLQLPLTMRAFIADGCYQEALELASYVRELYTKQPTIRIFKQIATETDKLWEQLCYQLVDELKLDVSLAKCVQIVSVLRRMEVNTEVELKLKFLHTRSEWLENSLKMISQDDANHHLTKTIEMTRVNLFAIITQYRTVFSNTGTSGYLPTFTKFPQETIEIDLIFCTWVRSKLSAFLVSLQTDLERLDDPASIDTHLVQTMYFGQSFSRVGCDFRQSLIAIFKKKICATFKQKLVTAVSNFHSTLERFTLISAEGKYPQIPEQVEAVPSGQDPPVELLEFQPIAEYCNDVLEAFNFVKLCSSLAVLEIVVSCLEMSLVQVAEGIFRWYGQEQQAFTSSVQREAFQRFCWCFHGELIPYFQRCLHKIYPPNLVAGILGVALRELQEQQITFLDRSKILAPIHDLIIVTATGTSEIVNVGNGS